MSALKYGALLAEDLANLSVDSPPLIEDFLYQPKVLMLAADPGVGKSLIATQIALSLSSATPLFGSLVIPKPVKVYYLQMEGAYEEFIERMRAMQHVIPIVTENLCWDTTAYLDVLQEEHVTATIKRIRSWGTPDCIIIDPIYMTVKGGLSKDVPASSFVRFSSILGQEFHASRVFVHHTHRPSYAEGKKVEEDDPFYGSQWLKAHVDIGYLLTSGNLERSQPELTNKKARGSNVMKHLRLQYHPETMTCSFLGERSSADAYRRVIDYLHRCKQEGKLTDFYDVVSHAELSHAHMRRILSETDVLRFISIDKSHGRKHIWKPTNL